MLVFIWCSASQAPVRAVKCARSAVGADRLLFGTDMPSNLYEFRYQDMADTIAQDPVLTQEQKQLILYENAKTVFWS